MSEIAEISAVGLVDNEVFVPRVNRTSTKLGVQKSKLDLIDEEFR